MKVTKVFPRGFCKGVVDAWEITKIAKKENPNSRIIMIGHLVHNKEMVNKIISSGIEIIDDSKIDRLNIVKNIIKENNKKNIVLIFSAHGTDKKVIDLVKREKIKYYDTICKYVNLSHDIIKKKLNENKIIFFIGVKNHPEAIATQSINYEKIFIIEKDEDINYLIKNIKKDENIFLTNQTTMSIYDIFHILKKIKKKFKNLEFKNDICDAASERQKAIINLDKDVDLLIIVGDKLSNNSKKMVQVGLNKNIESYLVENINDLNLSWFKNKKHVAISSGASTPTWITNEVIELINKYQ